MHIPDGFLNITTVATTYVVSAGGVGNAVRVANRKLGEKQVPLMGVLAAFIFAAQMLNFPIAGGTSGHVIGAALAAILLGPWAAVLVMSCVLIAQSLIFQDGGLLALGANIFNMGIIASFAGYYGYRLVNSLLGDNRKGKLVGSAFGAWSSVFLASIACALELALSGASPIGVVLPAMAGVHALIGIGEGLITAAVLSLVLATRADLMQLQRI
ncbi:MAG TPA: energy-coupling factor ABC transporter permease [Dehalococcoidales bacterium]|nr:energy-coupling factor ABC transporter permease [Dehalococcoidales bacterium]